MSLDTDRGDGTRSHDDGDAKISLQNWAAFGAGSRRPGPSQATARVAAPSVARTSRWRTARLNR
jgi:hypothetical protein